MQLLVKQHFNCRYFPNFELSHEAVNTLRDIHCDELEKPIFPALQLKKSLYIKKIVTKFAVQINLTCDN